MAISVRELKAWLDTLSDNDLIEIDDGGLCLQEVDNNDVYIEVGGETI